MKYKLLSLFDGSGGFPLAGSMCGVEPVAASEVEPYPIAVTRSRFPNMKHLGDISKINGAEIEPVDIITFGSPCQDLSVAGKRAGLKHEDNGDDETTRSGLFMEAVRIIREMRGATNGRYPTFALWENVPGAFSSNKGDDFRVVLEELIKIVEPTAKMPPCDKNGWPYADCYMGAGWSLAYRVFDAQYWGVPQRRRRIHLVLDLRGERAHKVLFEREGLRGYFAEGRTPRQATAGDAENCVGAADREGKRNCLTPWDTQSRRVYSCEGAFPSLCAREKCGQNQTAVCITHEMECVAYNGENITSPVNKANPRPGDACHTLGTDSRNYVVIKQQHLFENHSLRAGVVPGVAYTLEPGIAAREGGHIYEGVSGTLRAEAGDNRMAVTYSIENHPADSRVDIDESGKVQTLTSRMGTGGGNVPMVMESVPIHDKATRYRGGGPTRNGDGAGNGLGVGETGAPAYTVTTGDRHAVAYLASGKDKVGTLMANAGTKLWLGNQEAFSGDYHVIEESGAPKVRYIVRRLTPTECARLQDFPDRWGDIDPKEDFADEEYRFWLDVRNTHAAVIGGKEAKDYTKQQMLTWYGKLHTDSAEYKMWGNGIALPPALYCMQGIVDALKAEEPKRTRIVSVRCKR